MRRRVSTGAPRVRAVQLSTVGDVAPGRLGRELDQLVATVRLGVAEAVGRLVVENLQLALDHALVEPGAAEDEAPQPVHERALGGADELGPAGVYVLAERRGGVRDLAVDGQVDEVLALRVVERARHELELRRGLLDTLT